MVEGVRRDVPLSQLNLARGSEVMAAIAAILEREAGILVDLEAPDVEGFPVKAALRTPAEEEQPYWTLRWTGRRSTQKTFGADDGYLRGKTYACELTAYWTFGDYSERTIEFADLLEQAADWIEASRTLGMRTLDGGLPEILNNTIKRQKTGDGEFRYHVGTVRFTVLINDRLLRHRETLDA